MSNIINKSNHPVEIKRINVKVWRLRDEIEAAIAQRISETGNSEDNPVDIEDIKEFYINILNTDGDSTQGQQNNSAESEDANLDSSGNPMDDDAEAMMNALAGAQDEEDTADSPDKADEAEQVDTQADDEAAALAAEMLADQGITATEDEANGTDADAAELAAQMLADQGMGTNESEDDKSSQRTAFTRVRPNDDKIYDGFLLLADVQMDQVMFFSQETFIHGQNIIVDFLVPKAFSQMLEVISCVNIARNSRIISPDKSNYRIQAKFLFKFPSERSSLRAFLQSVEPEIPVPPKKLQRPDSEDDDDDFDDLGF